MKRGMIFDRSHKSGFLLPHIQTKKSYQKRKNEVKDKESMARTIKVLGGIYMHVMWQTSY